ncbi:sensor histidine kinase [Limnohabitans sp. DM1]|uniref:sensor histidine kinase n=1 Tax=Limnohabitans sp. DM1 TaxID=1597955 RepID=UPI000B2EBEFF|nr:ATP-binding protein [Limnohabitans sp. DM1]
MAAYNVQSLFVFYSIVSILGGLVACFYFKRLDTSARYWAVAALIAGVTNLATVFRAELPLLWSYSIPIGLNGMVFVLMGLGIVRLHKHSNPWRSLLSLGIGTVFFIAVMEWCRIHYGLRVTVVLSGGLFAVTSFWGSHAAHVYYKLSGNQFAMHMRSAMMGIGVVNVLRTQSAFTGWGLQTFGEDAWTLTIWSIMFLLGMMRYFSYLGMRVQQQADEKLKVAAALAREEEGRRLGGQLARLERQQSLGVMSASFAHELNQPLTAILNYAELLQHQLRSGQLVETKAQQVLADIVASSARAGDIIRRIRTFIQTDVLNKERVDIRATIAEVCALVEPEVRRQEIRILQDPMPSPVWVMADAVQLSQVLFNVMRNSMESMVGAPVRDIHLTVNQAGQEIRLSVSDTGRGLTDEQARQAGDPFYTTKISGLGMGLSISKTILAQFNGHLSLRNTGQGVCALIILPVADAV